MWKLHCIFDVIMPAQQFAYWSATCFDIDKYPITALPEGFSWFAGQKETCPTTGTLHWQLAMHTTKKKTESWIRKQLPRHRMSPSRSEAADAYVSKMASAEPGTYFELGVRKPRLNSKVDWARQLDLAQRGLEDQMDPGVYMRCYNTIKKIKAEHLVAPPDLDSICGVWIWGPPNTGKSHWARQEYPGIFDKPANKWWDGYKGEGPVLIDDFDKVHKVMGHHLKRWLDRYSFTAEVKGGTVSIRPSKVVITSNYSIEEVFGEDMTLVAAIRRRCLVIHKTEPWGGII